MRLEIGGIMSVRLADDEITKEVDVSAFRSDPLNVHEVRGALSRAIAAFERAGDSMREGTEIFKRAMALLEKLKI